MRTTKAENSPSKAYGFNRGSRYFDNIGAMPHMLKLTKEETKYSHCETKLCIDTNVKSFIIFVYINGARTWVAWWLWHVICTISPGFKAASLTIWMPAIYPASSKRLPGVKLWPNWNKQGKLKLIRAPEFPFQLYAI